MKNLMISIILPYPVTKPSGGPKIMYQYAVKLSQQGHQVTIYHSIKRPFKKSKTPLWFKAMMYYLRGAARPKWFTLPPAVKSVIVPSITDKYLANADIIMSTWWQTAYAVNALNELKGKKFNLVQDYEIWGGQTEKVEQSYSLGLTNIAISRYLQNLVFSKCGTMPIYLPNAIDTEKFCITADIGTRKNHSIIMLYSEELRKGTTYGLEALSIIQKKFSALSVTLFGVYPQPADLPPWITYYHKPVNLPKLYNDAAIFFSPSLTEGWALPPAEAMACGCAVVCTNIGGHADYAMENETALLAQPQHVDEMVNRLTAVLSNADLRIQLAQNGNTFITSNFSWDKNIQKLETVFYDA